MVFVFTYVPAVFKWVEPAPSCDCNRNAVDVGLRKFGPDEFTLSRPDLTSSGLFILHTPYRHFTGLDDKEALAPTALRALLIAQK